MTDYTMMREAGTYIRMVEESRYLDIVLMFNVQSVALLPQPIRESASIVICKRLNDKIEVSVIEKMMNFSLKEQSDAIMRLKIADAIYIDKERGAVPIPILVPLYPTQQISDEQIHAYQGGYIHRILEGVVRERPHQEAQVRKEEEELPYATRVIMEDVKRFAFDFQSEREIRLNMNVRIISDHLDDLEKKGLLRKHPDKINLGKGKGQFQPYLFTEKAACKFGKQAIAGKGSIEHAFWQYRCAKHFSNLGYSTEIEHFLSDRSSSIDLVVTKNDERVAIEIELNDTPHIQENMLKCINENYDKIIIAVYGSKLLKRVQQIALSDSEIEPWLSSQRLIIASLDDFSD
jgi:hypothetical protein